MADSAWMGATPITAIATQVDTRVVTNTARADSPEREDNMRRANRVVVSNTAQGLVATFYKTHNKVGTITQAEGYEPSADAKTKTAQREEFRKWAITKAEDVGVAWIPEYQSQSWERKYWKYETDEQVEEDAITLMEYTIDKVCSGCKYQAKVKEIKLDSIVPNESNLSYVEFGKYAKNGNWAVATVNLDVTAEIQGVEISIIYPIEMRSGQLTKIKLTKNDIDAMIADCGVDELPKAE